MGRSKSDIGIWVVVFIIIVFAVIGIYEFIIKGGNPKIETPSNLPAATSTIETTTPEEILPADWKIYDNPAFNYELKYPPTVTFGKELTTYASEDGSPTTYPASTSIQVIIQDVSTFKSDPANADIVISPLYVNVSVQSKPKGYKNLKDFVSSEVDKTEEAGQNSAAGVYATSSPITKNNLNGYLMVVSDGSVIKNRDDKYYFEHGQYIYAFDMAYSGYYYETQDKDEVLRVDTASKILSSFKFTK